MDYAELRPGRPGFDPVGAALYYAQRLAVDPRHRARVAAVLARRIGRRAGPASASHPPRLWQMRERGWLALGQVLGPEALAEVGTFLSASRPVPRGTAGLVEEYALDDVLRCPHLLALANDPSILAMAEAYLGCRPTLSMLSVRRSRPGGEEAGAGQRFHRDVDDWRIFKLFVYLSDVGDAGGPHVYVEGSHRRPGSLRLRPIAEDEAPALGRVVRITGARGFGFVADTYGIHRGEPPRAGVRLLAQMSYSIGPVRLFRYGHRIPAAELGLPLDPWVNRLFVGP